MSAAASPADILRAVGRASDALGVRAFHGNAAPPGWRVSTPGPTAGSTACVVINHPDGHFWSVAPPIALAFCLLLVTGAASVDVDVGRCPACVARSGKRGGRLALATVEWAQFVYRWWSSSDSDVRSGAAEGALRSRIEGDGWELDSHLVERRLRTETWVATASRPCPECTATTRATVPVARMLLDAVSGDAVSGDADALARLLEQADQLQERGDPIGPLLSWALTLWTGEPVDCGACPACVPDQTEFTGADGGSWQLSAGEVAGVISSSGGMIVGANGEPRPARQGEPVRLRCSDCCGSGRQLGHPHTADALAWLERLTDEREDDADEPVYGARFRAFQRTVAQSRSPG